MPETYIIESRVMVKMTCNKIDKIVIENFIDIYPYVDDVYKDFIKQFEWIAEKCFRNKNLYDLEYIGYGTGQLINRRQDENWCDPVFDELIQDLYEDIIHKNISYFKNQLNNGNKIVPLIYFLINQWLSKKQTKINPISYNVYKNIYLQVEKLEAEGILETTRSIKDEREIISIKFKNNSSIVLDSSKLKSLLHNFNQNEMSKVGLKKGKKGQEVVKQIFQKLLTEHYSGVEFDTLMDFVYEVSSEAIKTIASPEIQQYLAEFERNNKKNRFKYIIYRGIDCSDFTENIEEKFRLLKDCVINKINAIKQKTKIKLFDMFAAFEAFVIEQEDDNLNDNDLAERMGLDSNSTFYDRFNKLKLMISNCREEYNKLKGKL